MGASSPRSACRATCGARPVTSYSLSQMCSIFFVLVKVFNVGPHFEQIVDPALNPRNRIEHLKSEMKPKIVIVAGKLFRTC